MNEPNELPRHTEARLQRELGNPPMVELHGIIKIQAGRLVGVFVGPQDMAECMGLAEFTVRVNREDEETIVGSMYGIQFRLLDKDLA